MRTLAQTRAPRDSCRPRGPGLGATPRRVVVDLSPEAVDQIARSVAQLLGEPQRKPDRLTAGELARELRVERSWIYRHPRLLGGERINTGPKAPWRFKLDTAEEALRLHQAAREAERGA
jgi:hypothetical protein